MNAARASIRDRILLVLLGLVLAARVMVPAGWMPAERGGFAITICNGGTMESAWVDSDGKLHKQAPGQGGEQHCAFAGLGAPMLSGEVPVPVLAPVRGGDAPVASATLASIGQGLAAPPPPATGPPFIV